MNTKKLRLEGQDIVTHDGQLVRPLSDNERILLAEVEARSPENYLWVIRDILHKEQIAWDARG